MSFSTSRTRRWRSSVLPMPRGELSGIEDRRIELGIHPDIGIALAEDILSGDVELHTSRDPSRRNSTIVREVSIGDLALVALIRIDQADEKKTLPVDPELLRFQIPGIGAHHIDRRALPSVFMQFGQVEALAGDLLDGASHRLPINVEAQNQQHVDQRTG